MAGDRMLLERCLDELEKPSGDTQALRQALRQRLEEVDPGTTGSPATVTDAVPASARSEDDPPP